MRLVWTSRSLRNLAEIESYISQHDLAAADRMLDRIRTRATSLSDFPEQGRLGRVPGTRELSVWGTRYTVAYRIREDRIEVLAVVHASRRWPQSI